MALDTKGTITTQNLVPAGVATANSAVSISLQNSDYNTMAVQVTGTYTGALSLQVSVDGKTWVTVSFNTFYSVSGGAFTTTIASGTQSIYQVDVTSLQFARVTALAAVTGTATISLSVSNGAGLVKQTTPLAAGSGAIQLAGANNASLAGITSAATTNAVNTKNAAGTLYTVHAHNTAASDRFVRFYNKSTTPVPGTDAPAIIIRVPANSSKEFSFGIGARFTAGIGSAITAGAARLDATATAVDEVQLSYTWA